MVGKSLRILYYIREKNSREAIYLTYLVMIKIGLAKTLDRDQYNIIVKT